MEGKNATCDYENNQMDTFDAESVAQSLDCSTSLVKIY